MRIKAALYLGIALAGAAYIVLTLDDAMAQQTTQINVAPTDLGGVVTGRNGPEAGVWVIAETTDLPTKYAKVVVTDDKGRYLIPELPKANYNVWVRGYGLVDSSKLLVPAGSRVNTQAAAAPNEKAAAEYYPGMYWYSLLRIPQKSEFPGTGD